MSRMNADEGSRLAPSEPVTDAVIAAVVSAHKGLTWAGFTCSRPMCGWCRDLRAEGPPSVEQVTAALVFVDQCEMTKRPTVMAYAAKHKAEEHLRSRTPPMLTYIPEGALIAACILRGVPVVWDSGTCGRCSLGLSRKSLANRRR